MDNAKLIKSKKKSKIIYDYIRTHESVSKQDIVVGLKLSLPTVTQNLQYLIDLGLVDTSMKIMNTGGRSATAFTYVRNARLAIGVYLTAHHITVISVDLCGNIVEMEKEEIAFDLDDDGYLKRLGELVVCVKEKTGIEDHNLLGVGIAVQGLVSEDGEEVIYGLTLNFTGKTRAQIARYIPYPNRLFHDSEVAGHAEVWIDNDVQDAFYINAGNSFGGAVVIGNQVHPGDTNKGGELGHVVAVAKGGERCYCGKYGCFDTVCRATKLSDYTGGDLEKFFAKLKEGDRTAKELWGEFIDYLSLAIHIVRMLFNGPVILGGYVGTYIGEFMEDIYPLVDERNPFGEKARNYLIPCKYKVESAAAGAAISYIDQFFESI